MPTPCPTRTSFPTPLVVQPTPYAPTEPLPTNFPRLVYAIKRGQDPIQLWALQYDEGLLHEELFAYSPSEIREGQVHPVLGPGQGFVNRLAASPDGQYIAISRQEPESGEHTLFIDSEGHIYQSSAGRFFTWIPGGEWVIMGDAFGVNWGAVNIDGSESLRFPNNDIVEAVATPDGKWIVFSEIPIQKHWMGTINVDNGTLIYFDESLGIGYGSAIRNLSPSPEGQICAFTWDRNLVYLGTGRIWTIGIDGSNPRPLGPEDTYDFDLAWSPDGRSIAFVRQENPDDLSGYTNLVSSLWLIDVKSGQERQVLASEGEYAQWALQWLPDGSGLVFLSNRDGESNAWFIRTDGTGLQQLTRQGGVNGEVALLLR